MGGAGSGIAYDEADLRRIAGAGLQAARTTEVLLEESILGWKEYELELMRDRDDNVVVVCSIENLDPMGVHTGDSITVAPALTLTDREYQRMRDIAIAIIRAVGVDTGGCNIQFAVDPDDRPADRHRDEPAGLALERARVEGDRLPDREDRREARDRLHPRRDPERHHPRDAGVLRADARLRRRQGAAVRVREVPGRRPDADHDDEVASARRWRSAATSPRRCRRRCARWRRPTASSPGPAPVGDKDALVAQAALTRDGRLNVVQQALRAGATVEELHEATGIDPWFLDQMLRIEEAAREVAARRRARRRPAAPGQGARLLRPQIGELRGLDEAVVRELRHALGVRPVYKTVDTCAAEFAAKTPYHYSSYDEETEVAPRTKPAVLILGSGPNRIGQGIEFDYSCVHAALTLRDAGYETVMVNCNPETVSTDYDTSDRLYFEPLTLEDVLEVVPRRAQAGPVAGVIVQLGGQTPLGLAQPLKDAGVPIVGTSPEAIHLAEERGAFGRVLAEAGLPAPKYGIATTFDEAQGDRRRHRLPGAGPPVLRARRSRHGDRLRRRDARATTSSRATQISPEHPVLVDRFLDDAVEIDVDALFDGDELYLGGVMEHIEEAGIHSGDSACALPPITLGRADIERIRASTEEIARGVGVRGLLNVQYALAGDILYVLEANPRASRTVPFVSQGDGGAAGQGGGARDARRDHRASCAPRACCPARATAARCRWPRRSRSRRPCCRSAASAAPTPCSARRCARPARSWASTRSSAPRSRSRRPAPTGRCRPRAGSSSRSPTATSGR